jgi:hypothetical protein
MNSVSGDLSRVNVTRFLTFANVMPVVLGVTFYILLKKHWETRSPMLTLFYRDGVFYFIALASKPLSIFDTGFHPKLNSETVTSSANIAIIRLAPVCPVIGCSCQFKSLTSERVSLLASICL